MVGGMALNSEALARAANESRGLSIDAVAACSSGHLGLPLGTAELGAVLFGHALNYWPEDPKWLNRDRFVLSAGHGSMFLYSWLHLAGFDLPLEQVKNFRQLHSTTPGHPEFGETPGVESTTGPLGQGVGNAVGYAVSARMAAARFNGPKHVIFNQHVVCLAGDGCLQEGVSAEASAFAARQGLDNLIIFYDSNHVTLDAMADKTQCEDTAERYRAYGFEVTVLEDGHDLAAIHRAYEAAKAADNGQPKLIILHTEIGRGIPEVAGTEKAHGEGGAKFAEAARKGLGLPEERFYVSEATRDYFSKHRQNLQAGYEAWQETFRAWQTAHPDRAELLHKALQRDFPAGEALLASIAEADPDKAEATRGSGGRILNAIAKSHPLLVSGSADLHGSTKNYLDGLGDFDRDTPEGRNFYFGIREHGMGAILNGIAYDGIFEASGATFLTFSDYMRGSVRLAALAKLPVFYIWTHDSVGVGEDGPTHQPVETVAALRCMPNLEVYRPADAEETAGAYAATMQRKDGPTALILTRQNVPQLNEIPVAQRRGGTLQGGYIARREKGSLETILIATGSELHLALQAAAQLGDSTRVVSLPCFERFDAQPQAYRDEVLPPSCRRRVSIEAGVTLPWYKYVGCEGRAIGIDRFGLSAPGGTAMKEMGITAEAVVEAVRAL